MHVHATATSGDKYVVALEAPPHTTELTLSRAACASLALHLGRGEGRLQLGHLTAENRLVSVRSAHSEFHAQSSMDEGLQAGMQLWISAELDEGAYRAAVVYPQLHIEADTMFANLVHVHHTSRDHTRKVAIIPDLHLYLGVCGHVDDQRTVEFEHAGVRVSLLRRSRLLEINTISPEGNFAWLASPEEERALMQHARSHAGEVTRTASVR